MCHFNSKNSDKGARRISVRRFRILVLVLCITALRWEAGAQRTSSGITGTEQPNAGGHFLCSNFENIRCVDLFPGADLGLQINHADENLGGRAGELWVPPNPPNATISTAVTVGGSHVLRFWGGSITIDVRGGAKAITLKNNASLVCSGGAHTTFGLSANTEVAAVVTNDSYMGGQQFAAVRGCFFDAQTNKPTVSGAVILFQGIGQLSTIADNWINVAPGAPGIELVNDSGVLVLNNEVNSSDNAGVGGILETSDTPHPNAAGNIYIANNTEHFSQNGYGIKFAPHGSAEFRNISVQDQHCEQRDKASSFDCVLLTGEGIKSAHITNPHLTQNGNRGGNIVHIAVGASGVTVENADGYNYANAIKDDTLGIAIGISLKGIWTQGSILVGDSLRFAEGKLRPGTLGLDVCEADSATHGLYCSYNGSNFHRLPIVELLSCAMDGSSRCTATAKTSFMVTPRCFVNPTTSPKTAVAGSCSISGTTVTVEAGESNSLTWNILLIGNPN
jgi:hypothetical protein